MSLRFTRYVTLTLHRNTAVEIDACLSPVEASNVIRTELNNR